MLGSCQGTYFTAMLAVYICCNRQKMMSANLSLHYDSCNGQSRVLLLLGTVLSCESQDLQSDFMSIHVELASVTDRHRIRARTRVL